MSDEERVKRIVAFIGQYFTGSGSVQDCFDAIRMTLPPVKETKSSYK